MDVSFVIPTRNRIAYLAQTVRSIRDQNAAVTTQIVIVDDASDEPCQRRFESDPLFRDVLWVRHPETQGPGCARQTGVNVSSGRYIGFVDDDDLLEPCYLQRGLAVLDSDATLGLFCCDATLIDESGATLRGGNTFNRINAAIKGYSLQTGVRSLQNVFEFSTLGSTGFLARREVFKRVAYPPARRLEDYEFQLGVAASGYGIYYCHEPLARYRLHRQNVSQQYGLAAMTAQMVVLIRGAARQYPQLRGWRRRVADVETDLGIACLREREIRRGFAALGRAVIGDPRQALGLSRFAWRHALRRIRRAGLPPSNVAHSGT